MATATKTTQSKTATKTAAKRPAAPKGGRFNPADLPAEGTGQYRQGGDYKTHLRALGTFAKGDAKNTAHVKALIHLGWVGKGKDNTASKSPAFSTASEAGLPAEAFTVGEPAGPQISANMVALAEAGAPEENLVGLWAAYVGGSDLV